MKIKIGTRLHSIRNEKKLTQDEMADILGIPSTTYGRIERGETSVQFDDLSKYSEALGLPIQDLLPEIFAIHNNHNQNQSGLIFGNIYNYYDRTEYTKELEIKIKLLENENLKLKQLFGSEPQNGTE